MNGVYNALFILMLFLTLVAFDYLYSISDITVGKVNTITGTNPISVQAYVYYGKVRDIFYTATTGILIPFFVFLSFASSFINRNQGITTYIVSSMMIMLATPLIIYLFTQIMTQMYSINILNPAYMATSLLNNFIYILVANMLLSLSSFVFIRKTMVMA